MAQLLRVLAGILLLSFALEVAHATTPFVRIPEPKRLSKANKQKPALAQLPAAPAPESVPDAPAGDEELDSSGFQPAMAGNPSQLLFLKKTARARTLSNPLPPLPYEVPLSEPPRS